MRGLIFGALIIECSLASPQPSCSQFIMRNEVGDATEISSQVHLDKQVRIDADSGVGTGRLTSTTERHLPQPPRSQAQAQHLSP